MFSCLILFQIISSFWCPLTPHTPTAWPRVAQRQTPSHWLPTHPGEEDMGVMGEQCGLEVQLYSSHLLFWYGEHLSACSPWTPSASRPPPYQQAPDKCPTEAGTHLLACSLGTWPGGGLSCSHLVVCHCLPRNSEASFLTSSKLPSLYNKCRKHVQYHQSDSHSCRQGSGSE